MDGAIERGEFVEAAAMSDRLMQRKVLPIIISDLYSVALSAVQVFNLLLSG